ncbi:hypothetical protein BU16DRAFT_279495 [Lophium mytilinum]|uniref:Wax synthase domain-containing protein n=1 Tax=Lophium mytilinum TaxID=390894 RepID=A0A6A6R4I8_9PEZI|nr:hypothetical protein BU16DRAFT_279495 [Lophium mytilinum]
MHPIVYLFAEIAITVFVIGFTPPNSLFRLVGLLAVAFCVFQCIPLCMPYMIRTPWAALVGGYSVTYAYHYLDVALLSRWSFEQGAPVSGLTKPSTDVKGSQAISAPSGRNPIIQQLLFGLKITFSWRFIDTPYQIKNVPPVIAKNRKDFLLRTFVTIAISYVVLDIISSSNDSAIASKFLGLDKVPFLTRLNQISAEELVIRAFTVLAAGIGLNCVQGGIYHVFALLAVSSGISEPSEWPPFYGSVRAAYSLRAFWNIFWHQTNARKFSSISHYTVHNVLMLPRGTTIARYLRVVAAFMSSGIMHLLDDLSSGVSVHDSGAMRFFVAQALGMIIEDSITRVYGSLPKRAKLSRLLERVVGFIWVALFLTWSVPAYMYPMMWRGNLGLNDSTIPFSFFGSNAERLQALACLAAAGLVSLSGIRLMGV